jgi:O-6-methylguanine DNA methyltransferase
MNRLDETLRAHFAPVVPPRGLAAPRRHAGEDLGPLLDRLRVEATARGVARVTLGGGAAAPADRAARRHAVQAVEELREYLGGRRTFFDVPLDLGGLAPFQARVLAEAARIPFGGVTSYAALAARVGRPRAARAVGNALGANPVPLLVPCHRVVRGDGTWGHYVFGGRLKTALLRLERDTPALVGCTTTRIVCRHGCPHEQRVREDRRVVFASVADAAGVGYRPCRACRPELTRS